MYLKQPKDKAPLFILILFVIIIVGVFVTTLMLNYKDKIIDTNRSLVKEYDKKIEELKLKYNASIDKNEANYEDAINVKYIHMRNSKVHGMLADEIVKYVNEYTDKYNIHKSVMMALITVESNFNIYAVSSANCLGLTQINHKVWKKVLKDADIVKHKSQLFHPKINIEAGAYVLRDYLNKKKSYEGALRAYFGNNNKGYYDKIMLALGKYTVFYKKTYSEMKRMEMTSGNKEVSESEIKDTSSKDINKIPNKQ